MAYTGVGVGRGGVDLPPSGLRYPAPGAVYSSPAATPPPLETLAMRRSLMSTSHPPMSTSTSFGGAKGMNRVTNSIKNNQSMFVIIVVLVILIAASASIAIHIHNEYSKNETCSKKANTNNLFIVEICLLSASLITFIVAITLFVKAKRSM